MLFIGLTARGNGITEQARKSEECVRTMYQRKCQQIYYLVAFASPWAFCRIDNRKDTYFRGISNFQIKSFPN